MIEKIKNFYEEELKELKYGLSKNYAWTTPQTMKNNTLQRMLGVVFFAQAFDVDFRDIEVVYNDYREQVEAL